MRQNTKYYITTKCTAGRPHPATTPSRMAGTRPPKLTNQDSPLSLAIGVSLFPMESQERKQRPWRTQYKCSRHSACHTRGARIGIGARAWVELPLLMDKEKPHNCRLLSDDQSITVRICQIIGNLSEFLVCIILWKCFDKCSCLKLLIFFPFNTGKLQTTRVFPTPKIICEIAESMDNMKKLKVLITGHPPMDVLKPHFQRLKQLRPQMDITVYLRPDVVVDLFDDQKCNHGLWKPKGEPLVY